MVRLNEGLGSTLSTCHTITRAEAGTARFMATKTRRWLMCTRVELVFEPPHDCSKGAPLYDRRRHDKLTISGFSLPCTTAATRSALQLPALLFTSGDASAVLEDAVAVDFVFDRAFFEVRLFL